MPKVAFVVAMALIVVAAGGWARSNVASTDMPMGHSAALDIQALQAAATDLPVHAGDNAI
jgi:hypothetical protein